MRGVGQELRGCTLVLTSEVRLSAAKHSCTFVRRLLRSFRRGRLHLLLLLFRSRLQGKSRTHDSYLRQLAIGTLVFLQPFHIVDLEERPPETHCRNLIEVEILSRRKRLLGRQNDLLLA